MPVENFRLLHEHGANLSAIDQIGTPLILKAAEEENWPVVSYMLEHGANLRQADRQGRTLALLVADRLASYAQSGREVPSGLQRVNTLLEKDRAHP
jgi:ankyrin repeat protein